MDDGAKMTRSIYKAGRRVMLVDDDDDEDGETEDEKEDQSRMIQMKKNLEEFVNKFASNVPDPIVSKLTYYFLYNVFD